MVKCGLGPATGQTEEDQRQTSNSARTATLEGDYMVRWTQLCLTNNKLTQTLILLH